MRVLSTPVALALWGLAFNFSCMDLDRYRAESGPAISASGGTGGMGSTVPTVVYAGSPGVGSQFVPTAPSCLGESTALCQGESCCSAIQLPGGTFPMGRSEVPSGSDYFTKSEADEIPEHTATVGPFALDKYEVTVGRFREFAAHYDEWHVSGGNPQPNSGRHPLAGHTGWGQSWTMAAGDLPANAEALLAVRSCDQGTWTEVAGTDSTHESYPMNCVTWFEAFAFCIWDGGRLPTEAEWEYVAAGGVLNRLYPWGADAPDNSRLNYWGSDNSPSLVVGSKLTSGAGYFGHADLAGSVSEWVFDWYDERYYGELGGTAKACDNCAFCDDYANPTAYARVHRGGSWSDGTSTTRAACRGIAGPSAHNNEIGFRCARDI